MGEVEGYGGDNVDLFGVLASERGGVSLFLFFSFFFLSLGRSGMGNSASKTD